MSRRFGKEAENVAQITLLVPTGDPAYEKVMKKKSAAVRSKAYAGSPMISMGDP